MTILSYAEEEFKRSEEFLDTEPYVIQCLEKISLEGHSGGSMGIYSGMLAYWINHYDKEWSKVYDTKVEDSMHYPLWLIVKDLEPEFAKRVLWVTKQLMTFTPLSFITGEDSEWVCHDEDERLNEKTLYQHKRMGTLFKTDSDPTAYWIDGIVYYEPNSIYTHFNGYTGSFSRVPITFPFDPKTKPKEVYFQNTERSFEIEEGRHEEWLEKAYGLYREGYNPITHDYEKEAFFTPAVEVDKVLELIPIFDVLSHTVTKEAMDWFYFDLFFYAKSKRGSRGEVYLGKVSENIQIDPILLKYFTKNVQETSLYLIFAQDLSLAQVRAIYRLTYQDHFDLKQIPIFNPDKHYQRWILSNDRFIRQVELEPTVFGIIAKDGGAPAIYIDTDGTAIYSEPNKYLYNKCKELGLEYKGGK